MAPRNGLASAAVCALAACASATGIDRPMALDPGYAAREASERKPADRCGPEFISDHLPTPVVSLMGPLLDGSFRPVCARHDACYELREQTQAWCDARMRTEMLDICNAGRSDGSIGGALCRLRASMYFGLVDNAYGAYSYHGGPGGRIVALDLADAPAGKLKICATVENSTPLLQTYAVELRTADRKRIARAPEVKSRSVRAGQSTILCAGPVDSAHGRPKQISTEVEVRLVAGDPDSLAMIKEMIIVDRRTIPLAQVASD